jgi:uncharacterized Fe-S cluster-containing protein
MIDIRDHAIHQDSIRVEIMGDRNFSSKEILATAHNDGGSCLIEIYGILISEDDLDKIKSLCNKVSAMAYVKGELEG